MRIYHLGQKKKRNHRGDASCDIEESAVWFCRDAWKRGSHKSHLLAVGSWIKHPNSSISQDSDFMHQQHGSFFFFFFVQGSTSWRSGKMHASSVIELLDVTVCMYAWSWRRCFFFFCNFTCQQKKRGGGSFFPTRKPVCAIAFYVLSDVPITCVLYNFYIDFSIGENGTFKQLRANEVFRTCEGRVKDSWPVRLPQNFWV